MLRLAFVLLASTPLALAQDGYQLPPPEVVEILDAAPAPGVSLSPDGAWMLMTERPAMPSIEDVARPMERLAGLRIDPVARARYTTGYASGLVLRKVGAPVDGSQDVRVPVEGRLERAFWAPDSRNFAFTTVAGEEHRLYTTHVDDPSRQGLVTSSLNSVFVQPRFVEGGRGMLYADTPGELMGAPELEVALAPAIQETGGETTPTRTYQDLLGSARDAALFDHLTTTQLVLDLYEYTADRSAREPGLDYENAQGWELRSTTLPEAAVWTGADLSPDGEWLLTTRLLRPYSYLLPYYAFPSVTTVQLNPLAHGDLAYDDPRWDALVVENKPLDQNIPIGGVRLGRRSIQWHDGEPAALLWVTALDGGDPKAEVSARDAWFTQAAPFDAAPVELFQTQHRARGLRFTEVPGLVIASDYDRDRRWTRAWLMDLTAEGGPTMGVFLEDRASRDAYADPGDPLATTTADGSRKVRVDEVQADGETRRFMYLAGQGASPEGLLPFLDRFDVDAGVSERLWRCAPGTYESVAMLRDERMASGADQLRFVTRFESQTVPPNYQARAVDLASADAVGAPEPLTAFPDPTPTLRGVHKELVTYERADGVPLSATLYLPEGYVEGSERLPLLVWAYPREYNDASTAGQVTASDARFTRVAGLSHLVLLTQGYAILDGATMPILGDAETMNDRFIEQIVSSAEAAIDFAVERGVADRDKVVVGGHSYGAFMTANLLAHSDLFATGIARSGAYNRTLTPFGFQSERRTFWEAPEAYFAVSPFMHADQIDEPLLMIHGEIDNNSGTFPMQSERLFQAIKGNGGTARLVMLPAESHGYRARESVLHAQAETIKWLKRFVK